MSLTYPRFIHAEAKTHRVVSNTEGDNYILHRDISLMDERDLSRNAMSSRAVPVAKMIDQVRNDPAMPVHWGSNKPGMQAGAELINEARNAAIAEWLNAAGNAAHTAEVMNELGLHKQVVNRILEPFQWMHTIVTATEWDNFYDLRCHAMAEPNMQALAYCMRDAVAQSMPVVRAEHLPYIDDLEIIAAKLSPEEARMVSAARCARVSYLNHDGTTPDVSKDLALATMLRDSKHASPFEHQAVAADDGYLRSRNFVGWRQHREALGL
jgi:thymidylate synthase ThyX